ncbi:hypothetical protein [Avibacterium endocarditidis]|uniref:hypothetical protein n=1 Tax=Avibacterium endocarditidis TaxID=380674 RepID=UPI001FEC576F|nr:hypothetical protein [Avibacterium endocarditidis]
MTVFIRFELFSRSGSQNSPKITALQKVLLWFLSPQGESNVKFIQTPDRSRNLRSLGKMVEDIAKVAILAVPVIIFGQNGILFKIMSSLTLMFVIYATLVAGKLLRKHKSQLSKED